MRISDWSSDVCSSDLAAKLYACQKRHCSLAPESAFLSGSPQSMIQCAFPGGRPYTHSVTHRRFAVDGEIAEDEEWRENMVPRAGIEPPTRGFSILYSTNLSTWHRPRTRSAVPYNGQQPSLPIKSGYASC